MATPQGWLKGLYSLTEAKPLHWLNPFYMAGRPKPFGVTKTEHLVRDMTKTGVSWAALMAAVRLIQHKSAPSLAEEEQAAVNASNPILSPDDDLSDTEEEKKLRSMGVQKEAWGDKDESFWNWLKPDFLANKEVHPVHFAALLLAAAGSGYGGYALTDKRLNEKTTAETEGAIDTEQNKLDRELYREYLRTRGYGNMDKEAGGIGDTIDKIKGFLTGRGSAPRQGLWQMSKAAWTTYAVLTSIVAFKAMQSSSEKSDPAHIRMKKLKEFAKEDAKYKPSGAAGMINLSSFPAAEKAEREGRKDRTGGEQV